MKIRCFACGQKKTRKGSKLYKSSKWFRLKKGGTKVEIKKKIPKFLKWTRYCRDCELEIKEANRLYAKEN